MRQRAVRQTVLGMRNERPQSCLRELRLVDPIGPAAGECRSRSISAAAGRHLPGQPAGRHAGYRLLSGANVPAIHEPRFCGRWVAAIGDGGPDDGERTVVPLGRKAA